MGSLPDSRWHSDGLQQADALVGCRGGARGRHRSSLIVQPAGSFGGSVRELERLLALEMAQALDLEDAA